jgi:hypothetical protein
LRGAVEPRYMPRSMAFKRLADIGSMIQRAIELRLFFYSLHIEIQPPCKVLSLPDNICASKFLMHAIGRHCLLAINHQPTTVRTTFGYLGCDSTENRPPIFDASVPVGLALPGEVAHHTTTNPAGSRQTNNRYTAFTHCWQPRRLSTRMANGPTEHLISLYGQTNQTNNFTKRGYGFLVYPRVIDGWVVTTRTLETFLHHVRDGEGR